jgi:hypothetical protein
MTLLRWPLAILLGLFGMSYLVAMLGVLPGWSVLLAGGVYGLLITRAVRARRSGPAGLYRESPSDAA